MSRPLTRSYARIERERRFVLTGLPRSVDPDDFVRLRDHFIEGTGLRLRRVERPDGREILSKLGQKLPDLDDPADRRRARLTTIYLTPGQAEPLRGLPGPTTCKRRFTVVHAGLTWAIDCWEEPEPMRTLVLAEIECPTDEELEAVTPPPWCVREVSHDPRFSAFSLATADSRPT